MNHRKIAIGTKLSLALSIALYLILGIQSPANAQAVILYQNNFETPNVAVNITCATNLNQNQVNTNYGQPGFTFQQIFTVETVIINAPGYSDPTGRGGNYSLGMLRSINDDRVSMTFNAQNKPFINVQFDTAATQVTGCGVSVTGGTPTFEIRAYDAPNGTFNISSPGTLLDSEVVTGVPGSGATYTWATVLASLDISAATTPYVAIYWDLQGTAEYATIDNLVISSSTTGGGVGTVNITESSGSTDISESGTTDTYTIALASVPTSAVTITATPDAQCNLGGGGGTAITLNFPADSNALLPQTVTVTAVDDAAIEGAHNCVITHSSSSTDSSYNGAGVNFVPGSTVTAHITDNDPPTSTPTSTGTATQIFTSTPTSTATNTNTPTSTASNTAVPPRPDTIGVYQSNGLWYLRNTNSAGAPDIITVFGGDPNDLPVTGDWNGDSVDTIGIFRTSIGRFFLSDSNTSPTVSYTFMFGNPDDIPFAGRWDNTINHDGIGVYRPSNGIMYQGKNLITGFSDYFAIYGNPGDKPVAGDWEGDGFDSIGVYRMADLNWHLTNNSQPNGVVFGDFNFTWDIWTNAPVVGDWNGDVSSTVAYFTFDGNFDLHSANATAGTDNIFSFGPPRGKPVSGKWIAASRPPMNSLIGGSQSGTSGSNANNGGAD